eukprot:1159738-Pelagomonas_calceolata.AAC.1
MLFVKSACNLSTACHCSQHWRTVPTALCPHRASWTHAKMPFCMRSQQPSCLSALCCAPRAYAVWTAPLACHDVMLHDIMTLASMSCYMQSQKSAPRDVKHTLFVSRKHKVLRDAVWALGVK